MEIGPLPMDKTIRLTLTEMVLKETVMEVINP